MTGNQASRLPHITCVVKEFSLISVGEGLQGGRTASGAAISQFGALRPDNET